MTISVVFTVQHQTGMQIWNALSSLFAQTQPIDEIIVLDMNLDSNSISYTLQDDVAQFPGVTYLQLQAKEDVRDYRNLMLHQTSGEYIVFMDACEVWHSNKLERHLAMLGQQQNVLSVISNGNQCITRGAIRHHILCFEDVAPEHESWLYRSPIYSPGQVLYQRQALLDIGGFRQQLGLLCDLDAVCRLAKAGQILLLDTPLLDIHVTQDLLYWRRLFFSHQQLLTDGMYLDMMLTNGNVCHLTYHRLAVLATRGKLPLEAAEYYTIGLMKAPVRTIRSTLLWGGNKVVTRLRRVININRSAQWMQRQIIRYGEVRTSMRPARRDALSTPNGLAALMQQAGRLLKLPAFSCMGSEYDGGIVIPEGITAIGRFAFAGCHHLKRIVFPDSVNYISDGALMDCTELTEVLFSRSSTLNHVGKNVFAGCTALEEIQLPDSLTRLSEGMFAGCRSLRKVSFMTGQEAREGELYERISEIPAFCFAGCASLRNVYFGRGSMLEKIGPYAYSYCSSLWLIWVDSQLSVIGEHAFDGCTQLSEIVMAQIQALTRLGREAFRDCASLKQFPLSPNLTIVAPGAFRNCRSLQSMRIPLAVRRVKKDAFYGCSALFSCIVENPDVRIEKRAFEEHTKLLYRTIEE